MTTRVSRREMQNFTQHVTQQVKSLDTHTAYLCLQAACLIESTLDLYSRVGGGKAKLYHLPSLYAMQPQISLESVPSSLVYRMRILGLCWRELKRFDHDLRSHPPSSNHNMQCSSMGGWPSCSSYQQTVASDCTASAWLFLCSILRFSRQLSSQQHHVEIKGRIPQECVFIPLTNLPQLCNSVSRTVILLAAQARNVGVPFSLPLL